MKRDKRADLDVKYILKTYWSFIKNYKLLMTAVIILALSMSALGFVGRYLFKKVVDNGELFAKNELTAEVFIGWLSLIAALWVGAIILSAIVRWFRNYFLDNLETKTMFDLKNYYYSHIVNLSHKFHTTHKTGSLISRITRGSSSMERMTDFFTFNTLPLLFELIISGIALATIGWEVGLTVLVTGIIFSMYSMRLQKVQRKLNVITNNAEDIEKAMIGDTFTNIDSIKYYGKEYIIKNKFKSLAEKTKVAMFNQWTIGRWMGSGEGLIMGLGAVVVLMMTIRFFIKGEATLGTVSFAWALYWAIIDNVRVFMEGLRGYNRSVADFYDLFEYGKVQNDIKDKPNALNLQVRDGIIEFKNVSFKYHESNLFKDFSLIVPKNKKVALVGHSGSGKSTLVKLLYRLYDLDKGKIKIDGIDIKDVKQESLRSELSIVPQECVLFDDTIYNNILFSNPKASRAQVLQAIKFAQLDKTIANFPNKENTIVGERGVKLSGGEKQRVSIARALLANKKVLVLDEATSSLDSKTEHEIQKDLQNLMQGRTSIIIAHRLSTIMSADLIVVLKEGKIVQQGTHEQLIKQKGEYKELWSLQKGGYISD
ncbi:ABC transporter ATP-binding protein [Candidatus Pacearchaeota archaeon]|nr:ABC transporter ATP-binding protein [Candidatus Pacearchaeota archaeon]